MKSFLKILGHVLPYKRRLAAAILFAVLFAISNGLTMYTIVPIFTAITERPGGNLYAITGAERMLVEKKNKTVAEMGQSIAVRGKMAVNDFFAGMDPQRILVTASLCMIGLIIIRGIFDFISRSLFTAAGNLAVRSIRIALFSHLLRLPYAYFHRSRSGEIVSRITRDVIPLAGAITNDVYNFFSGFFLLATNLLILSFISWKMILLVLLIAPLVGFPVGILGNKIKKYTKKIQEGFADLSSQLNEAIAGIKVIKSFGMEDFENRKFYAVNHDLYRRDLKKRVVQNLNPVTVELFGSIATIAIFIAGGHQIIAGEISTGEFIFFLLLVLNLFEPVKKIASAFGEAKMADAISSRIFQILDYPAESLTIGTSGSYTRGIHLDGISHHYAGVNVIRDINIAVPRGRAVAIAGASGSGKSTILNLIASLYMPAQGRVLYDDRSTAELSLSWVRENSALVTQEVFLFNSTIRENITCGRSGPEERMIRAAQIAHAHDFIMGLPLGYDTVTGERGMMLSGGERQRITIARALYKDPAVFLFDEATASLDAESEKTIQDALAYLFTTRTSVIISHRRSTIQNASVIYVIDQGAIIDQGRHDELLNRCERYRQLFERPDE